MRAITSPVNNFMVRLGQLKAVVLSASTRSEAPEKLARRTYALIGMPLQISFKDQQSLVRYIGNKVFEGKKRQSRYPDIAIQRTLAGEQLVWTAGPSKGLIVEEYPIEAQDAYLSDAGLPSNLGAVGQENAYELVNWAGWLSLINERRRSIHSLGHALRLLISPTEQRAFSSYDPRWNPYRTDLQRPFFLYLLLQQDGDVLCRLYPRLLDLGRFTRMEAVVAFRETLDELRELLRSAGSIRYLQNMRDLKNLSDTIQSEQVRSEKRGKRALTGMQRVSPRLENLVDLGLLMNSSADGVELKLKYEYSVTGRTAGFVRLIARRVGELDEILRDGFFRIASELFEFPSKSQEESEQIFRFFIRAYRRFPRELGGKPIRMLALVAANDSLLTGAGWFEISDVEEVLDEFRLKYPGKIRLSGGHIGGRVEFVVIDDEVVEKYHL